MAILFWGLTSTTAQAQVAWASASPVAATSTQPAYWQYGFPECMDKVVVYTLSGVPTTYRVAANPPAATVTGGVLVLSSGPTAPGGNNNGVYTYTVRWNDLQRSTGTVEPNIERPATYDSNGNVSTWQAVSIPKLAVTLRNLSRVTLDAIVPTGDLTFGGNTPITLCVPQVSVAPGRAVQAYRWTLPSGWAITGPYNAGQSTGAPLLVRGQDANCITVTPTPQGSSATVRVSAVDTECSDSGYTLGSETAATSLTFSRPTPPLTIISNRSPQGGPISLFCGESLSSQQVRPSAGGPAANWSGYSFSRSGIVSSFCCLQTASPGLYTTGVGTGTISLTATYTRNGASTTVTATPVTVTVRPELAAPRLLTTNGDICPGATKRYEVSPVPGATSYAWSVTPATPGFGPYAATSVPYIDIVAPAATNPVSLGLTLNVAAAATSSCAASATATLPFQYGAGAGQFIINSGDFNAGTSPPEVCGNYDLNVILGIVNGRGQPTNITWSTSAGTILSITGTGNGYEQAVVRTPTGGQFVNVTIACNYTDGCGISRNLSRTFTVVNTRRRDGVYCQGVINPRLYPNPVAHALTIYQPQASSVMIYNAQGKQVLRLTAEEAASPVSMHGLPNGLYYVELQDGHKGTIRQRLQVQHD